MEQTKAELEAKLRDLYDEEQELISALINPARYRSFNCRACF